MRGSDVDLAYLGASGLGIEQLAEGDRHEAAALERNHRGVAAAEQELGGAVPEVAAVRHVVRDRVHAAELVADVVGDQCGLDSEALETRLHRALEEVAESDLRQADVAVLVALDLLEAPGGRRGRVKAQRPPR